MALIDNKYFQSKHVRIFPSSFRGNYSINSSSVVFDPEARLNTEANFILPKVDLGKNTYIIDYISSSTDSTNNVIKFILGGYYFEISEIDNYKEELKNKFVCITLRNVTLNDGTDEVDSQRVSKVLDSWEDTSTHILDKSTDLNQTEYYYFTGLKVADTEEGTYTLKLFDNNGNINQEYLLPEINHGTGINALTHGEGLIAAGNNQTIFGTYNDNNSNNIFEIGKGTKDGSNDPQRLNALEISNSTTTINNETSINGDTTVTGDITINGAAAISGITNLNNNTSSTSITTGALTVSGGVGINENLNVGGDTNLNNKLIVTTEPTGSNTTVRVAGTLNVTGETTVASNVIINNNKTTLNKPLEITDTTTNALKVSGDATITKNLSVGDTTKVLEVKPTITGDEKNVTVTGTLSVSGASSVGSLAVNGNTQVTGQTDITGNVNILGNANKLTVNGPTDLKNSVNITGATTIATNLTVSSGTVTLPSLTAESTGVAITQPLTLSKIIGNNSTTNYIEFNSSKIKFAGNTEVEGNLQVGTSSNTKNIIINGQMTTTEDVALNKNLTVNNNLNIKDITATEAGPVVNTLTIGSTTTYNSGALDIYGTNTDKIFSVANSGDTTINGALNVSKMATLTGGITVGSTKIETAKISTSEIYNCSTLKTNSEGTNSISYNNSNWVVKNGNTQITLLDNNNTTTLNTLTIAAPSSATNESILFNINTDKFTVSYTGKVTAKDEIEAASFNATSDRRLKTNINLFKSQNSILELPVYTYDYINGTKNNIGCIAQDLQEICPELVSENENGYLSVKESKLVYLLLEEIKKLNARISKLEKE